MPKFKRPDSSRHDWKPERDPCVRYLMDGMLRGDLLSNADLPQIKGYLDATDENEGADDGYYLASMRFACQLVAERHGGVIVLITNREKIIIDHLPEPRADFSEWNLDPGILAALAGYCAGIKPSERMAREGFSVNFERMPKRTYLNTTADRVAVEKYGEYLGSTRISPEWVSMQNGSYNGERY